MMTLECERLEWLAQQLGAGWHVETPVIERTVYSGPSGRASAFEFVLCNERACQIVAVPDCPELHRFLYEHTIATMSV